LVTGELVGIVGTSGSGKTTLLNLLGGLDTPTGGTLQIMGHTLNALDARELALFRRSVIGIIFQVFHLLPARTAIENVELPLMLSDVPRARRRELAGAALDDVGLHERFDHLPSELSGGEQQRVAIARALVKEPQLLLADEPTGNLDSATSREIMDLIQRLNRDHGITIVLVSHDQQEVGRVADRIVTLDDGKIAGEVRR